MNFIKLRAALIGLFIVVFSNFSLKARKVFDFIDVSSSICVLVIFPVFLIVMSMGQFIGVAMGLTPSDRAMLLTYDAFQVLFVVFFVSVSSLMLHFAIKKSKKKI